MRAHWRAPCGWEAALDRLTGSASSESGGEGGGAAFLDDVARRYRGALNSFFRRRLRTGTEAIEDLTQEVFLRLARRRSGDEIAHVDRYLFQVAAAVLVDHRRRGATRIAEMTDAYVEEDHAPADFSPERVFLGKEQAERALAAVEALPERARHAVLLFRFEGLKQVEIARRMGISVSAVEKHIRLGMLRLAEALRDEA